MRRGDGAHQAVAVGETGPEAVGELWAQDSLRLAARDEVAQDEADFRLNIVPIGAVVGGYVIAFSEIMVTYAYKNFLFIYYHKFRTIWFGSITIY